MTRAVMPLRLHLDMSLDFSPSSVIFGYEFFCEDHLSYRKHYVFVLNFETKIQHYDSQFLFLQMDNFYIKFHIVIITFFVEWKIFH